MKTLPLGTSDFKKVIETNRYYVDKSLFIKELVDMNAEVTLIPRPRRFGKTLNLSMLKYFFEAFPHKQIHHAELFKKLAIWDAGEKYRELCGKYPVIFFTFKDNKELYWSKALEKMKISISKEFERHSYLREGTLLSSQEKIVFDDIVHLKASESHYESALEDLSRYLYRFYGEKAIILVDEYDMPVQAGYLNGYYNEIINFMRNFLSAGLKDNPNLERGVLTGILKVSKESIFSGLNNPTVATIVTPFYSDKFGFTEAEVISLLKYYSVSFDLEKIRSWYNGYMFGEREIYNPWSIIEFVNMKGLYQPYWVNTSSNEIIKRLLSQGGEAVKKDLETLMSGQSIEKQVNDNIIFSDVEKNANNLWNFLFFSGYLKATNLITENRKQIATLCIPNEELLSVYEEIITNWFSDTADDSVAEGIKEALIHGDIESFEELFSQFIYSSLSYFDVTETKSENFYHAFVLGMMVNYSDVYKIKSNRESGLGRYDVLLIPKNREDHYGIVFEFKKKKKRETLDTAVQQALNQIKDRTYAQELVDCGVKKVKIIAIAFDGKKVLVECESYLER